MHRDSPREEKLASVQSRGLASIGSTADTQALLDGLRKEFMQQNSNDKQQAEERANKERAYRQETEKDIKDVRERLDYLSQQLLSLKNEALPQIGTHSNQMRVVQSEIKVLQHQSQTAIKNFELLQPVMEVKADGIDLRTSLVSFMMDQWLRQFGEIYAKISMVDTIVKEQDKRNDQFKSEIGELQAQCRALDSKTLKTKEFVNEMKNYAFKVDVDEIQEKLKLMPTIINMDSRFQNVEKAMESQMTRIQNEFILCTEYENLQKSKDAEVAKLYLTKTDYKEK